MFKEHDPLKYHACVSAYSLLALYDFQNVIYFNTSTVSKSVIAVIY